MTTEEIKKLKVHKVKCDNSLLFFTRYFFKKLKNRKFIVNWHHNEICEGLEKVADYKASFMNINIPPRHSKTELVVNFIAQNLGKNPQGNYLYITASDDLRSETSVKIRDIITCPEYKLMYGVELKKDQNAKNLWRTSQGGGLKTATISGQITGFGAGQMIEHDKDLEDYIRDFEGCIILDDINKISDAVELNANNEKANKRIFDTVFSRTNSEDTPIINIQQRSGTEDATASLLKFYDEKADNVINLVLPVVIDGQPLWPWKMSMEKIEKIKTHPDTCHMFETQYMQNPQPIEGILFPRPEMKRFSMKDLNMDNLIGKITYIDTADKGADYYSAPLGYIFPNDNNYVDVYITKTIFTREPFKFTKPAQIELINRELADYAYIETNKEGSLYVNNIQEGCPNCFVQGIRSKSSIEKETRILMQSEYIIKYFYFLVDSEQDAPYKMYFDQLTTFLKQGGNKNDDAPDSTAGLSRATLSIFKTLLNKKENENIPNQ